MKFYPPQKKISKFVDIFQKKWGYCDRIFSFIIIFRNLAKFRIPKKGGDSSLISSLA